MIPLPSLTELGTVMPDAINAVGQELALACKEEGINSCLMRMNQMFPEYLACQKEAEGYWERTQQASWLLCSLNRNLASLAGLREVLNGMAEALRKDTKEEDFWEVEEVAYLIAMAEANVAEKMENALQSTLNKLEPHLGEEAVYWSPSRGFHLTERLSVPL